MLTIEHGALSEQGNVRFKNEDAIDHHVPYLLKLQQTRGYLTIIADGVGGHGAGDVASSEAIKAVTEAYYAAHGRPDKALASAVKRANLRVFDLGIEHKRFRMQTTLSALALVGRRAYICHVGDTRIYRLRGTNQIDQLTRDDTEVAELVRMQILDPEKVRNHPRRNLVTKTLGGGPTVTPMSRMETVEEGDAFVLCTDGLWEPIHESEMLEIVRSNPPPEACAKMVQLGLDRQATDNLSVQVIKVVAVEEETAEEAAQAVPWWRKLFGRNGAHPTE